MKVLHSYKGFRPDIEGGVPFSIGLLSRLANKGIASKILVARQRGWTRRYEVDGVAVEAVASLGTFSSTPLSPTLPFSLLQLSKAADLVVHHAPFPLADLALPWLPKRVALIVYWHADILEYSFLKRLLTPAILRTLHRADRIIVSDPINLETSDTLPPFAAKCSAVPFGTDVDYWSTYTADELKRSEEIRKQYPRLVLSVGRLVPYKGVDVLVEAMKDVEGHAIIIGDGPLGTLLKRRVEEYSLTNKITFIGRATTSELKTHMHAASVLAFPSITSAEAFGIVQLEAMAGGLPIVNTALNTAVPRVARHNQEALTIAPKDPSALSAALSRILDDQSLAERLGKAGQIRARAEYSQHKYLARMADIFRDVVRKRQGPELPLQDD